MTIADELVAILGYETTGEGEAKRFEKTLDGLNKKLDKFATSAGKIAGYASLAVATGFGILGKSVVETSAQFESYQATLETIEGSAEKARASLDWIAEFGKSTPYDVAQVTDAFVKLKAYGIDPVANDSLRVLGDTASAMGKPLTQAVEAFADAATGEFERLKEFGIKAKTAGDDVTFAWTQNGKEMTETVKKSSNEIRAFLLNTMGDRFSGAMDRQSKTWNGMMSNLGDTWTDFKRRIGEAGFFDVMTGNLEKFLNYLGQLDADGTLDEWAENLSTVLTGAANIFSTIAERIGSDIGFLIDNFDKLKPVLVPIGAALAALIAYAFPVITAFVLLGLAVDDFISYLQGGESFIGDFIESLKNFPEELNKLAGSFLDFVNGIDFAALTNAFFEAYADIMNSIDWSSLGENIGKFIGEALIFALKFQVKLLYLVFHEIPMKLLELLVNIDWGKVGAAWVAGMRAQIEFFVGIFKGIGISIGEALLEGLLAVGDKIKAWFVSLIPEWAMRFIGDDPSAVAQPNPRAPVTVQSSTPSSSNDNFKPVQLTDDALDYKLQLQQEEWGRIAGNLNDNLAKMVPEKAVNATITDSRSDNRQAPVNSNVTVNQTVTQASQAPRAAATATGNAVVGEVAKQRSQLEMEPSF